MKYYIFIGSQRSGHHAIMKWFAAQHLNRDFTHYNNCSVIEGVFDGSVCNCCNFKNTISDHNKNKNVVFNFENKSLEYINHAEQYLPICKGKKAKKIIVLRDHYNWIASYINKWNIKRLLKSDAISVWKDYAKKILELQNFLDDEFYLPEYSDYDYILYNKWCKSKEYRALICAKYKLHFTDAKFKEPSTHGEGSSFTKLDKKDQKRYDKRSELFINNTMYQLITNDAELRDLTNALF